MMRIVVLVLAVLWTTPIPAFAFTCYNIVEQIHEAHRDGRNPVFAIGSLQPDQPLPPARRMQNGPDGPTVTPPFDEEPVTFRYRFDGQITAKGSSISVTGLLVNITSECIGFGIGSCTEPPRSERELVDRPFVFFLDQGAYRVWMHVCSAEFSRDLTKEQSDAAAACAFRGACRPEDAEPFCNGDWPHFQYACSLTGRHVWDPAARRHRTSVSE